MRVKWSLSALQSYEGCAYQYKLKYIDKLGGDTRSDAASRGVEIHAEIEAYLRKEVENVPQSAIKHAPLLTELRGRECFPEHKVALSREWQPVQWDERWYGGIFDLKVLGPKESEASVYDWKTGKIYDSHDDQKSLYTLAIFAEHPAVLWVRAVHVYVDLGKVTAKAYHRDEMHNLRNQWNSRANKLEVEQEWLPNPSFKCRYCPFSKAKGGPCRF